MNLVKYCPEEKQFYPVEILPKGWETAEVTVSLVDGKTRTWRQIVDQRTGLCYFHEPLQMIRIKCALIFFMVPLYSAIYLYPNNLKSWFLATRKQPGFDDCKWLCIANTKSLTIVESRPLWRSQKPTFEVVWV